MTCDWHRGVGCDDPKCCPGYTCEREPIGGMCTACGSVEVILNNPTGVRDMSDIGESDEYLTGYGCEVCS